jgi:conjugal transfer pilus assembly protein TrbC
MIRGYLSRSLLLVLLFAGVASLSALAAQSVSPKSTPEIDIESIRARTTQHSDEAAALAAHLRQEADKQREVAVSTATQASANLEKLGGSPLPASPKGSVDFDDVIKGATASLKAERGAPMLMVFASLSMPPQSLKALIQDTAKAGGVVLFRGFPNNDMKSFATALGRVIDDKMLYGNIGIDPRLFRSFNVQVVPAYVVSSSDFDACDGLDCTTTPAPFDRMAGNVTLDYALTTFVEGRGPGAAVAGVALAQLRRKS